MDEGRATEPQAAERRDPRAERLSRALRDNLKRRKAQARARLDAPQSSGADESETADSGGQP